MIEVRNTQMKNVQTRIFKNCCNGIRKIKLAEKKATITCKATEITIKKKFKCNGDHEKDEPFSDGPNNKYIV